MSSNKVKSRLLSGKNIISIALIFLLNVLTSNSRAQLTVDNSYLAVDLVQNVLIGTGVTVLNIDSSGLSFIQRGRFDGTLSNLGLLDGVILSSGPIGNAPGPNDCAGASGCEAFPTSLGQGGDPDLDSIIKPITTNDASVLEFDFIPASDTIKFNYIFASEEYPEYVGSLFNDVFGFFLSGPGISGGGVFSRDAINIALIPGTPTPVSINTVNNGLDGVSGPCVNCPYYIHNGTGSPPSATADTVQYDGFTTLLTAIGAVTPCDTFHIKLAVGDGNDFIYDSGVFLEANSFSSGDAIVTADFGHSAPKCVGENVDFLDNSSGALNYSWDFGVGATPATSTLQNPTGIVYSSPGLKQVRLISASCSDSDTITKVINILDEPVASFTPSKVVVCMGDTVSFANTGSTSGGWTYSWDFGSGAIPATSSAENPGDIQYSTPGIKTIIFTISNANCDSTVVGSILVNVTPTADFTSTAPACTDRQVDFANTGTTGAIYDWNFDLYGTSAFPGTSIDENPAGIVYDTSGSEIKFVRLVTTLGACVDSSIQTINITEKPIPAIAGILPACEGTAIDFNYAGTNGTGWTFDWDFGAGAAPASSTAKDPQGIVYSGAGSKTVTLTVTNGICSDTVTQVLTIDPTPVAAFASTAPSCTGDDVDFSNTGTTGATYSWDFDLVGTSANPGTSIAENPTGVVYDTSGSGIKYVRLVTTLGSCVDTSVQTINLTDRPIPSFTHNAPQCEGDAVTFNYTGSTGTGWTYSWDFGTGATPSGSTSPNPPSVTYSGSGTKTAMVTVTNGLCADSALRTFTINQDPVAIFTSTAPACTGDDVDFSNTGTTGATYSWDFDLVGTSANPGTSTAENPAGVVYDTSGSGIKYVRLVTTLGSCVDTSVQTINLTDRPIPSFTHNAPQCEGDAVTFNYAGSTGMGWTYSWDFGTGATPSGSTSPNPPGVAYSGSGPKTAMVTVTNGLCADSAVQTFTINQDPVAAFTSTAPACTGDGVDFSNTGTTGATYSWDFDLNGTSANPATSTAENPAGVVYDTSGSGIKYVRMVTTLGSCVDTSVQTINLTDRPIPSFTHTAPKCEGDSVTFNYTGSTGTGWTYSWDFGTGASPSGSTSPNPPGVVYSGSGQKTAMVTVTNGLCADSATQTFTINQDPVAAFTSTAPSCTGDSVDFANTGTAGATSYNWNFGLDASPATSADENPANVVYSTAGIKAVRLVITLGTCVDTITQTINTNQTPSVSFTSNTPVCAAEGVDFTNGGSTGGNWTYSWDFGEGAVPATSTSENPLGVIYSYGGTKTVTFTITDGICLNTSIGTALINTLPIADAGPDTTICADATVQIGSPFIVGNTYNWFPSDPLVISNPAIAGPTASPVATYTTYIVTVTESSTGCKNVDSVIVTMVTSALVSAGPDVEMCFGDSVQIGSALVEGQTYAWTPIAGLDNPSLSNPIAKPDSTTLYTVSAMYENCPPITDDVLATVHPLPDAKATDSKGSDTTNITLGSSVQLFATGGMQYEWTPVTGLDFSDINNPIASPDTSTNYVVKVTDIFGCVNTDTVRVDVDSLDLFIPTAFTPDGNGISDVFYVRIAEVVDFELFIFDRWGEQLFISRDVLTGWDGRKQDSGKEMPEGAYVYSFKGTTVDGVEFSENGIINLIR